MLFWNGVLTSSCPESVQDHFICSWDRSKLQNPSLPSLLWRLVKYTSCHWEWNNSRKRWFGRQKWVSCLQWLLFLSGRSVHMALDQTKMHSVDYFLSMHHNLHLSEARWQSDTRKYTNAKCGLSALAFSPLCQEHGLMLWVLWQHVMDRSHTVSSFMLGLHPLLITLTIILVFMVNLFLISCFQLLWMHSFSLRDQAAKKW